MKSLDVFEFTNAREDIEHPVCVVIIHTIQSGKIRRDAFSSWDRAREHAEKWQKKNAEKLVYKISIERM